MDSATTWNQSNARPLFRFHEANGARMVPFAGWEMPVQYTGIIEEHLARAHGGRVCLT